MTHTLPLPSIRFASSLLAVLFALAALRPSSASACSCMAPPGPEQAAQAASAVFEGRVTRIEDPQGEPKVHLQIVRSFKGTSGESIEVRTANNSAACGYGFEEGKSYLVYADEAEGVLSTNLCTRTRLISEAGDDLKALGLGNTPFDPGPGGEQAAPPAAPTAEPKKGGCASCTIGAREAGTSPGALSSLGGLLGFSLALGAAYRITSRRRSGSRS